jgi:hypothetical protein
MNFVERFSINYPIILYSHINDTEFNKFGEIVGMPTTIIYSPEGELLQTFMGEITVEDLNKYITTQLDDCTMISPPIADGLNEKQRQSVTLSEDINALILAGAGSWKDPCSDS